MSPDGKTHNQIDHILVNGGSHSNALDVRLFRAADCDIDLYLVVAEVKERLAVNKQTKITKISYGEVQSEEDKRGRGPLGRSRHWWVDNIRMDLGEVRWGDVDWIGLAQDRNRRSSCKLGIEPLGSIKCWETIEWPNNCWPHE
jgi:hypothetical protein